MAVRLQIILKDSEYREIKRLARLRRLTISEWVRQALGLVDRRQPARSVEERLRAIREAARHDFPINGLPGSTEPS
jgi:sugar phosphate isomerase/epimerase